MPTALTIRPGVRLTVAKSRAEVAVEPMQAVMALILVAFGLFGTSDGGRLF